MELKHIFAKDQANKTVTLLLYGGIGEKIDGDYFAREIDYLSNEYDEITIRINSPGGNVIQGLSIFNAMLQSKAFIIAQIDGIAASMAGVIPMAADRVVMNDFARIMIHNPFYPGRNNLSNKDKKTLETFTNMLTDLLSRRGVDKEKISDYMEKETWFTADEAKELGLIDEVISTGKAKKVENFLSGIAAEAITPDHFTEYLSIKQQQANEMEAIAKLFGLSATASEAEVTTEIKALQLENDSLKAKVTELDKLSNDLKAEKEAAQKKEVEALADMAIKNGYFAAEQRDTLIKMGENSFDTFKGMIDGLKKPVGSLSAAMQASAGASAQGEEKKDFEWYRRNDPQALSAMQASEPERFNKLYSEWEKANM